MKTLRMSRPYLVFSRLRSYCNIASHQQAGYGIGGSIDRATSAETETLVVDLAAKVHLANPTDNHVSDCIYDSRYPSQNSEKP